MEIRRWGTPPAFDFAPKDHVDIGTKLGGLDFDSMLASYVLDPGRRAHTIDVLAVEFLQIPMTGLDELTGKGKQQMPFDELNETLGKDEWDVIP